MRKSLVLLAALVAAIGLTSCSVHLLSSVNAGVVVTNPIGQSPTPGLGTLNVVMCSSESTLHPNWWVNVANPHPIPSAVPMMSGDYTVSFSPIAGYTTPAPARCHVWSNATTTLTVTYGHP
jgi:hypothetical protein